MEKTVALDAVATLTGNCVDVQSCGGGPATLSFGALSHSQLLPLQLITHTISILLVCSLGCEMHFCCFSGETWFQTLGTTVQQYAAPAKLTAVLVRIALYRMGKKGGKSRRKAKGSKYPSKAAGQDEEDTQMSGVQTNCITTCRP